MKCLRDSRAFTMAELLVLITAMGGFAGLLVPVFSSTHERACRVSCSGSLKQMGLAMEMYAEDWSSYLPHRGEGFARQQLSDPAGEFSDGFGLLFGGYVSHLEAFFCPSEPEHTLEANYDAAGRIDGNYFNLAWDSEDGVHNRNTLQADRTRAIASDLYITYGEDYLAGVGRNGKVHRGEGHNVLYIDGRVRWHDSAVTAVPGNSGTPRFDLIDG